MSQRAVAGIVAYGAYIPFARLDRRSISQTIGQGGGKGYRAVASYDEDTTSMAVEASRNLLASLPNAPEIESLVFGTCAPPYLDKTNANAIHAALNLSVRTSAFDAVGSVRSGIGALVNASSTTRTTLVALSDTRTGLPGSSEEANGGDAAASFLFGASAVVAELIGSAHATEEFLDRWRTPGAAASSIWEERYGESKYVPLAAPVVAEALKDADVGTDDVAHAVVGGVHARAVGVISRSLGVPPSALVDDITSQVGNAGIVATPLALIAALEKATPGEVILQVSVADGIDVLVWRATAALPGYRAARDSLGARALTAQIAAGNSTLAYPTFLTWTGQLTREPPRRPDPDRPAAPPAGRAVGWKFGFEASRCVECGTRHLPPMRVCLTCHSVDRMDSERLANVKATVATFTIDHLAFSPSPPVVSAVIDFDGGGRFNCEMTDVDPATVHIGMRVEMTFRRLLTAQGVHNYFWKARPARS